MPSMAMRDRKKGKVDGIDEGHSVDNDNEGVDPSEDSNKGDFKPSIPLATEMIRTRKAGVLAIVGSS